MNDYPQRIKSADQLIKWFGYWPSFHDAEIMWIKLERGYERLQGDVQVEFLVNAWELVSEKGKLESQKHCLVHFRFENCADIKIDNFNQQNQLSTIDFVVSKQVLPQQKIVPTNAVVEIKDHNQFVADEILTVKFISEFGIEGGFKCSSGEIVNIIACDDDGTPITSATL